MYLDTNQLARAIVSHVVKEASRAVLTALAHLLLGTLATTLLALAIVPFLYSAKYVDASGADCLAFDLGNHEVDLCYGRIDR